jgi:hypothetical protein
MNITAKPSKVLIDAGHSTFKFTHVADDVETVFNSMPSYIVGVNIKHNPPKTLLDFEGQKYAYGKEAIPYLPTDAFCPTSDLFIGSDNFYLLVRAVLHKLKLQNAVDIDLAIPDGLLADRECMLIDRIFSAKAPPSLINNVRVIGQGAATMLMPGLRLKSQNCLFVDVGHKTILVSVRHGSRFNLERSRAIEGGGGELLNQIARKYTSSDSSRRNIANGMLIAIAQKIEYQHLRKPIRLDPTTVAQTNWSKESVFKIAEVVRYFDDIDNVILSGGCGKFLREEISKLGAHLNIVEVNDPQFAVLRGMTVYARVRRTS